MARRRIIIPGLLLPLALLMTGIDAGKSTPAAPAAKKKQSAQTAPLSPRRGDNIPQNVQEPRPPVLKESTPQQLQRQPASPPTGTSPGGSGAIKTTPAGITTQKAPAKKLSKKEMMEEMKYLKRLLQGERGEHLKPARPLQVEQIFALYQKGKTLFDEKKYAEAVPFFWRVLRGDQSQSEFFEPAKYHFAASLFNLDFNFAALEYYADIIRSGSGSEHLIDAMQVIERYIREKLPIDEEVMINDMIYETPFGYLPKELEDFVNFYKGKIDLQEGYTRYSELSFAKITPKSHYYYEKRYIEMVEALKKNDLKTAVAYLDEIIAAPNEAAVEDLKNRSRHSRARLLYELKQFDEALDAYKLVEFDILERAPLFLERGLIFSLKNDYQKALGLFHALGAPIYRNFFAPERYIYMALIYKDLCMYNEGVDVLKDFAQKYSSLLKMIKQRQPLLNHEHMFYVVSHDTKLRKKFTFLKSLEYEEKMLGQYKDAWKVDGLMGHFRRMYQLTKSGIAQDMKIAFEDKAKELSNTLLEIEEQAKILLYEVKVDSFRRLRKDVEAVERISEVPLRSGNKIYWPFRDEYWTDELEDYLVVAKSKCDEILNK